MMETGLGPCGTAELGGCAEGIFRIECGRA